MDLSKLPKLSRTGEQGNPPAAVPVEARVVVVRPQMEVGAEVWISFLMGVVFLFLGGTFGRYVLARATGGAFHTGVEWLEGSAKVGQEVGYFELQGYTAWTDASLFLFGAALVADGLMLLSRRRGPVWVGFGLTVLAVAMNAVTAALLMSVGIMPLMSIVAVAMGGYMAAYQWRAIAGVRSVA